MQTLAGKVAVVTGAASGIGLALAERFAREGMVVVLADVEAMALANAEKAVRSRGARTLAVRTDVTQPESVDALSRATLDEFGAVHVVCNNAGVGGAPAPTWEQPLENWRWVLGVNLWGVIHGLRTFVPILVRQGEGHVVNTASMAGHISLPLAAPYHATKFAVVTISESLLYELRLSGSPVGVSVLCPGFVRTNIMEDERNRPADLRVAMPISEAGQQFRQVYTQQVATGLDPAVVAARVVEAIRADRFWIFPHPDLLAAVRDRMEAILAQREPIPAMPPPAT